MDRRAFLGSAGAMTAAVVIGASPAEASFGGAGDVGADASSRPVVEWDLVGGFVVPGFQALRPPRLVVYPGGLVIADAERQIRLRHPELGGLSRQAVGVLRNPANGRRNPGAPVIADAPATLFQARDGAGHRYQIQAEALEESSGDRAYPGPLYSLLHRLGKVHDRTLKTGQTYLGSGVRLVALRADGATGAVKWPAGVPVPPIGADEIYGVTDLRGTAARAVMRGMPRREPWDFPVYRSSGGRVLRASWRYLLPHELAGR